MIVFFDQPIKFLLAQYFSKNDFESIFKLELNPKIHSTKIGSKASLTKTFLKSIDIQRKALLD
jgi:hypothetical protein